MQSRGKLLERNWRLSDNKLASTDDISVFVIPLAPYKDEYTAWKRDYDGIRGMYDNEKDTGEGFGKLSLRTSPVASEKVSPHIEPSTARWRFDTGLSDYSDLVLVESGSVIVNGWEEKTARSRNVTKKDLEWKQHQMLLSNQEPGFDISHHKSQSTANAEDVSVLSGEDRVPKHSKAGSNTKKKRAIREMSTGTDPPPQIEKIEITSLGTADQQEIGSVGRDDANHDTASGGPVVQFENTHGFGNVVDQADDGTENVVADVQCQNTQSCGSTGYPLKLSDETIDIALEMEIQEQMTQPQSEMGAGSIGLAVDSSVGSTSPTLVSSITESESLIKP